MDDNPIRLRQLLRRIVRAMGLLERGEAACCGITLAQCHALGEIAARGVATPGELARALKMDPGAVTRVTDALVDGKLVRREPDPCDRRVVRLVVTPEGEQLWSRIEAMMLERTRVLVSRLPSAELPHVLSSLEHLVVALEEDGFALGDGGGGCSDK